MKSLKIIILSFVFALIVYGTYLYLQNKDKSLSPIPEEGVKVIQISPDEK